MSLITLAARKRGDKWAGALVIDGEFQDVFVKDSLPAVVDQSLMLIMPTIADEIVTITVNTGKPR